MNYPWHQSNNMLEFSNFIIFTLLSTLLLELFHLVVSVIFPCREYITGDSDQSITDEVMKVIQQNNIYATSKLRTTKCDWPIGLVIGRIRETKIYWFAYITISKSSDHQSKNYTFTVKLYSTRSITLSQKDTDALELDDKGNPDVKSQLPKPKLSYLTTYRKYGRWKGNNYRKLNITFRPDLATPGQTQIVDQICDMVANSRSNGFTYGGFFVITGPTGCGKSTIAKLVASRLEGSLCDNFALTQPGYSIYDLLHVVEPDINHPLVLLLDEFDQSISSIHKGETESHKWLNTLITDKASWNTFADQLPDYDNLIVIATTNRIKEWFDQLDSSYLRPGRVNRYFNLSEPEGKPLSERINQLRFLKTKEE